MPALREMEWDVAAVSVLPSGLDVRQSRVTLEVRQDRVRVAGGRQEDVTYFAPGGRGANMLRSYGGYLGYSVLPLAEAEGEATTGVQTRSSGVFRLRWDAISLWCSINPAISNM